MGFKFYQFLVYISDRRLLKAVKMLCVSAASHGRRNVSVADCLLLKHVFWQSPEDQPSITKWLWKNMLPPEDFSALSYILEALKKNLIDYCDEGHFELNSVRREVLREEIKILIGILVSKAAFLRHQIKDLKGRSKSGSGYDHMW